MNISNLQILIKMKLFLLNHSFWNLKLGIQDVGVHQNRSPLSTRWLHCCQRNGMLGNFQVYFQVHHSEESGSIVHKRSWGSLESAHCCRSSIYKNKQWSRLFKNRRLHFGDVTVYTFIHQVHESHLSNLHYRCRPVALGSWKVQMGDRPNYLWPQSYNPVWS